MHPALTSYYASVTMPGDLRAAVVALFQEHGFAHTAGHSARVAAEAGRLATRFGLDATPATAAGWLHDISTVVPNEQRIGLAEQLSLAILPEERTLPMIIHQKLSAVIAADVFAVTDPAILSAIGCHTTLHANASPLDMAVFVADKIAWDQPGDPPYLAEIQAAAEQSLSAAACVYINYLWQQRETLAVVHPWLADAHADLCA